MDNGLLCEPTTTNLAASVIDVTNASTNGWKNQMGEGTTEISSAHTHSHSNAIHLKNGNGLSRIYFLYTGKPVGTTVTFSFYSYVVSGGGYCAIQEQVAPFNTSYSRWNTDVGVWKKISVTRKLTDTNIVAFLIMCQSTSEFYIDDIQLEARPYATSFTPTSRDAADRLTIAEWVVNKPQWTCEFDLSVNDKQVNWERPVDFWVRGERSFRAEMSEKECVIKGMARLEQISKSTNAMTTPHRLAITWDQGAVGYSFDGKLVGTATETSGEKVLSSIWMGDCVHDPFNGCIKNFRFSSTVHTAEKIAADSKLDALPVEDDTVLYMPLKEDLSMYGHYND